MLRPASGRRMAGRRRQMITSEIEAERHVDEEDPVPADGVGDDPADGGAKERRQAEDRPEQPQVLAALGRRVEVRHDGQGDREDRAATQALDPAEQDQLPHLLAETAQDGADQEQADREDDDRPAPEEVRQPAVDRTADRGRQQVDRDDPGVQRVPVEIGDDDRAARCRPRSGRARTGTAPGGSRRGSAASRGSSARSRFVGRRQRGHRRHSPWRRHRSATSSEVGAVILAGSGTTSQGRSR